MFFPFVFWISRKQRIVVYFLCMNDLQIIDNRYSTYISYLVVQYVHDYICLPNSQLLANPCANTMTVKNWWSHPLR